MLDEVRSSTTPVAASATPSKPPEQTSFVPESQPSGTDESTHVSRLPESEGSASGEMAVESGHSLTDAGPEVLDDVPSSKAAQAASVAQPKQPEPTSFVSES